MDACMTIILRYKCTAMETACDNCIAIECSQWHVLRCPSILRYFCLYIYYVVVATINYIIYQECHQNFPIWLATPKFHYFEVDQRKGLVIPLCNSIVLWTLIIITIIFYR